MYIFRIMFCQSVFLRRINRSVQILKQFAAKSHIYVFEIFSTKSFRWLQKRSNSDTYIGMWKIPAQEFSEMKFRNLGTYSDPAKCLKTDHDMATHIYSKIKKYTEDLFNFEENDILCEFTSISQNKMKTNNCIACHKHFENDAILQIFFVLLKISQNFE